MRIAAHDGLFAPVAFPFYSDLTAIRNSTPWMRHTYISRNRVSCTRYCDADSGVFGFLVILETWLIVAASDLMPWTMNVPVSAIAASTQLSLGSWFLIVFFVLLLLYFLLGVLFRKIVGGAEGYEVIPNYEFWKDLPSLIKDGSLYLAGGCRPQVTYDQI